MANRTAEEQQTVELTKGRIKYGAIERQTLAEALGKQAEIAGETVQDLRKARAQRATKFAEAAAKYLQARDAGTSAASVRGAVELYRLRSQQPIEFAQAIMKTDPAVTAAVKAVADTAAQAGLPPEQVAQKAWEEAMRRTDTTAANVTGLAPFMEANGYGSRPAYDSKTQPKLYQQAQNYEAKLARERKAAEDFNASLTQIGGSWDAYLAHHPNVNRDSPEAYDAFQRDTHLTEKDLPKFGSNFIANIESVARNPEAAANEGVFADTDRMIGEAQKEQSDAIAEIRKLQSDPFADATSDDPSMRELLAMWLHQPEVQWWAKQNGFNIGTATPVDPNSPAGREIAAGRFPNKYLVGGMAYDVGPDDMKALRLATAQQHGHPEDNVFRAMGLVHKSGPRTWIEVDEVTGYEQPPILEEVGLVTQDGQEGAVGRSSDGGYYWTTDNKTWTEIDLDTGKRMLDSSTEKTTAPRPLPGAQPTPITKTRRLEYREPLYGDPPGSVRGIDPETGKEVLLPPDKVFTQRWPDGPPKKGPSMAERINKARMDHLAKLHEQAKAAEAQALVGQDQQGQEVPGAAPTKGEQKASTAAAKAAQALPPAPLDKLPEQGEYAPPPSPKPGESVMDAVRAETDAQAREAAQRARVPRKLGEAPQIRPPQVNVERPGAVVPEDVMAPPLSNQGDLFRRAYVGTPDNDFEVTTVAQTPEPATQATTTSTMTPPVTGAAKGQLDTLLKREKQKAAAAAGATR